MTAPAQGSVAPGRACSPPIPSGRRRRPGPSLPLSLLRKETARIRRLLASPESPCPALLSGWDSSLQKPGKGLLTHHSRSCDTALGETGFPRPPPGQVPMLLWMLLLTLAPGRGQTGVPPKAFLLLKPPWTTAFENEKVTIVCNSPLPPVPGDVTWYDDESFMTKGSKEIRVKKSGSYRCRTSGSSLSDPVHVEFSSGQLILRAPHPIFEGDNVTLKCQGRSKKVTEKKVFYKDGQKLRREEVSASDSDAITLQSVSSDNGLYHCATPSPWWDLLGPPEYTSNRLRIQVQELFPLPVLTASPAQPVEGGPVTLTCETQLSPQRPDVRLRFRFFREKQPLGSGWSWSPELRILTVWREDSSYWCQAETETHSVTKRSLRSRIPVQRVPVSDVNLEIQPPKGQAAEGASLVLVCSVGKGTGTVTFSWHREGEERSLESRRVRSQSAETRVAAERGHEAGTYYCAADNGYGSRLSQRVVVTVRVPAARPVLAVGAPGARAVPGDVLQLRCEAPRGSPPILYRFYRGDVALGSSPAPSGGGASLNLSVTEEHSGNYSCEADNGLGAQRSEAVTLSVTVPVSRPVLTLAAPGTRAMVGDVVELHCEAQRGSPPILYRFYHEDIALGSSVALSGGGASFNLSLTKEYSGNYFCEADNGPGAQHSEAVTFNFTGSSRNRIILVTVGVAGGLLSVVSLAALVRCIGTQRKSEGLPAAGTPSYSPSECHELSLTRPSSPGAQELTRHEPAAGAELQPVYSNVGPGDGCLYSQIWSTPHTRQNSEADSPRMHREGKEPIVIYSELKKRHPDDSAGQASSRGSIHGDDMQSYENVPCTSSAWGR
ncbi:Fc receptor-like protein 3 isoform X2 [Pteropus medius]|uniref:Fc receptor-like protein 3 isoform X2 n=2 Tax=Pteropus vampyrus TaxID=132908 RepID=UPI00196B41B9|nr:Fc receptor-like protein 3 isoform X2 [Pteropus giganteus]